MVDEIWKPVRGHETRYEISDQGNVRSLRSGKTLKGDKNNYGYRRIRLSSVERVFIHRLVAEHFVKNKRPREYHYVNHINGNKADNRAVNLEWVSPSQNIQHAFKNGLNITFRKLSLSQVNVIRKDTTSSQESLAKTYNVSIRTISNIINYRSYLTEKEEYTNPFK